MAEATKSERPTVLLPKRPNAVFHHPMGFPLYDGLAMDMHAMKFAEALLKDNDELRAALVERVPLSDDSALQIVSDNAICSESGDNHGYVTLTESKAICLVRAIEAAHNINES